MRKNWIAALVLVFSLSMATAAYAKDQGGGESSRGNDKQPGASTGAKDGNKENEHDSDNGQHGDGQHGNKDDGTVTGNVYGKDRSNMDRQEEHKEDSSLTNAIKEILKNVADSPSADKNDALNAVIEKLKALVKMNNAGISEDKASAKLTDQLKAQVESGNNQDDEVEVLATLELKDGKQDEAKLYTEKALQRNPKSDKLYQVLSTIYKQKGDTEDVKVYVNGKQPEFDTKPYIKNGNTMIPLRAVSEALQAKVDWEAETRTVIITKDAVVIKLPLGSSTVTVNDQTMTVEVPAELSGERTMVPARFVSEFLKKTVDFDPQTHLVIVK